MYHLTCWVNVKQIAENNGSYDKKNEEKRIDSVTRQSRGARTAEFLDERGDNSLQQWIRSLIREKLPLIELENH